MEDIMNNYQPIAVSPMKAIDQMPLSGMTIGMAYVPWQSCFNTVYDLDKAFCTGTIFPCLDKPFLGRSGCK